MANSGILKAQNIGLNLAEVASCLPWDVPFPPLSKADLQSREVNMLLLVDLDGVTVDFAGGVCEEHNKITGESLEPKDVTDWTLEKFGIEDGTWQKPGFFIGLKPLPGAVEALWDLHQAGHLLWVVTYGMDIDFIEREKSLWVKDHIPFVRGIVFTNKKYLIPGDMLIDDAPEHLEKYPGTTVKINWPYNEGVEADHSFDSLYDAVKTLF